MATKELNYYYLGRGLLTREQIPNDVLEDIREAMKDIRVVDRKRKKKPYPTTKDLCEAIKNVVKYSAAISPVEFVDAVLYYLGRKGFYTGFVADQRVWRTYEKLVRKGVIRDVWGVVSEKD